MMKHILFLSLFLSTILNEVKVKTFGRIPNVDVEDISILWEAYKSELSVQFSEVEDLERRTIFERNHEFIKQMNANSSQRFFLRRNNLMHLKSEEIFGLYGTFIFAPAGHSYVPSGVQTEIDWVEAGAVTSVKNQGSCGSCWAFSAVGALEGAYFRKYNTLLNFAPQELVDCSKSFGNKGCEGGLMDYAFQYVMQYGIEKLSDYPYVAVDNQCHANRSAEYKFISGFNDVPSGDESALSQALRQGPVSVAVDASPLEFLFYSHGILNPTGCSKTELNHGILLVGQGTTDDGQDYYLVKNSWGTSWGMNGYARIARNSGNTCGIASAASYPV